MCGQLLLQRTFSGQLASRNFLCRPPEPTPQFLLSNPSSSIYIGKTQELSIPFYWSHAKLLNPHLCVVGMTGSGKSYFVKTFITRARLVLGTAALILDWAGEYTEWVNSAGGKVISLSREGVNLLDLGGATPHNRAQQVLDALDILTDLPSFPRQRRLTLLAIQRAYQKHGFTLDQNPSNPGLSEPGSKKSPPTKQLPTLRDVCKELLEMSRKEPEALEAHGRINSLILSSGSAFVEQTISLSRLLGGLVCVDLHSLPTESLRSIAGLSILQFVKERMRQEDYSKSRSLKLFVVVDEAWKIAADERSDVVSIVREGRKYGFGLIVASQSLTDVHKSIFANAGTVFAFRLALASERDYLRSSLSYSDHFERASHHLSLGQALVHLEPSSPVSFPKTFLLKKVDGEELISTVILRGENMELHLERSSLLRALYSAGLSDRQAAWLLGEFDKKSGTLSSPHFASLLGHVGMSKAAAIMLLRELGAGEKDILATFSPLHSQSGKSAILSLASNEDRSPTPLFSTARKARNPSARSLRKNLQAKSKTKTKSKAKAKR